MSHVNLLIHIVISTHDREMSIGNEQSSKLYQYLIGILRNRDCEVLAINGIPNHIHLLIDFSPKVALSDLMRDLKSASSVWMKECGRFPLFKGWSEGYFAASVSDSHKQDVIDYIKDQRTHHINKRYEEEYDRLMLKNGMMHYEAPSDDDIIEPFEDPQ